MSLYICKKYAANEFVARAYMAAAGYTWLGLGDITHHNKTRVYLWGVHYRNKKPAFVFIASNGTNDLETIKLYTWSHINEYKHRMRRNAKNFKIT